MQAVVLLTAFPGKEMGKKLDFMKDDGKVKGGLFFPTPFLLRRPIFFVFVFRLKEEMAGGAATAI